MRSDAYRHALQLLRDASTPRGFVASPIDHDNYKRVWTRDGVMTGLAALVSGEADLVNAFRNTLETILDNQHPLGFIASSVNARGETSYGGTVGRADNPSWAVIGLCQYSMFTGDSDLLERYRSHVEKCFHVLDIWEYNGKGLVYVPQSGDWADEYMYHGYLLFDQLLRVWALRLASKCFEIRAWEIQAQRIEAVIQNNYWNHHSRTGPLYAGNLEHQLTWAPVNYWFMGFNPSRIYDQFDLQANALALLLGIGTREQIEAVVRYVLALLEEMNSILPSFHPCITATDPDMMELSNNYAYRFRNHPYEFHNGGLWPVWNGLLAAALAKCGYHVESESLCEKMAKANAQHDWEFNECFHGLNKKGIGVKRCTWSASGNIIGEKALSGVKLF